MSTSSLRFLVLLLFLLDVTEPLLAKHSFQVLDVQREIDASKNFVEVVTMFKMKAEGEGALDPFIVCSKKKSAKREAYFKAVLGNDMKAEALNLTEAAKHADAPESVSCKGLVIPEGQRPKADEELTISVHAVYTELMQPLPESIKQPEEQKMMLRENLYAILPYRTAQQTIKVVLPSGELYSKTMTEPFRQEGEKLFYGPYHDIPPFKVQMLSLHFAHNNRFATATKVIKEVQISLWGRIYVEELYEIENTGAKLTGQWSRLDYTSEAHAPGAVITEFVAEVPRVSSALYFNDEIGNISTSRLGLSSSSLMAVLRPRYPLFGGWKTKFKFGYSVPLLGSLQYNWTGRHTLPFDFLPSISNLVILDYELRVVMPDGSHGIAHKLPFEMDTTSDKKHWYFDLVPRPVLVARKKNVVPLHGSMATVTYVPTLMAHYRKIFIFVSVVFCLFVAYIIGSRLDFTIVGSKEAKKAIINSVLAQMELLFKEHQDCLDELRSCITQMKNNHCVNKSVTTKSKIESKLKETDNKLTEGMAALKGAHYSRLSDVSEVLYKAREYQSRCFQLFKNVAELSQKKATKKEIEQQIQTEEKMVSHLAAGVQEALGHI